MQDKPGKTDSFTSSSSGEDLSSMSTDLGKAESFSSSSEDLGVATVMNPPQSSYFIPVNDDPDAAVKQLEVKRKLGKGYYGTAKEAETPGGTKYVAKVVRIFEGADRFNESAAHEHEMLVQMGRSKSGWFHKKMFTEAEIAAKTEKLRRENPDRTLIQGHRYIGKAYIFSHFAKGISLAEAFAPSMKLQVEPAETLPYTAEYLAKLTPSSHTAPDEFGYVEADAHVQLSGASCSGALSDLVNGITAMGVQPGSAGISNLAAAMHGVDLSGPIPAPSPFLAASIGGSDPYETVLPTPKKVNTMSIDEQLDAARKILLAVKEVHDKALIHADLHDGNFVVDSETRKVTAIDFGLAIALPAGQDKVVTWPRGNRKYAPNDLLTAQVLRKDYSFSKKTDCYNVGKMFAEYLTALPELSTRLSIFVPYARMSIDEAIEWVEVRQAERCTNRQVELARRADRGAASASPSPLKRNRFGRRPSETGRAKRSLSNRFNSMGAKAPVDVVEDITEAVLAQRAALTLSAPDHGKPSEAKRSRSTLSVPADGSSPFRAVKSGR